MIDNGDLVDTDEKLGFLLADIAQEAEYALRNPEDADALEDLHRAYQAVADFVAPTPLERRETVTANGTKRILVYRGFDLLEEIIVTR